MKKLLCLTVALLSVFISVAQKPIIIKGKIDNCSNRDRSYIQKKRFNPEKLQEETITTDFSISEDGTFHVEIKDAGNYYQRYWIHLGNEFTHLDLVAGDSIYMTLNSTRFDESIKYTGRGAGRNNYRRDVFLEFWDQDASSKINYQNNPDQFLNGLNSLTERKLELLNKYLSSGEIDSSYYQFERAMIFNDKANQVLSHNFRHQNHKNLSAGASRQIASILEATNFSDDHFMQFSDFRDLVRNLPGYKLKCNSGKSVADLKSEIESASTNYTHMMQLYFDKEIIGNYIRKARSLGEKNALLNFFSNQFKDPVLKSEIQIQKNNMRRAGGINSEIFRASLIIIFCFVVFIGVVFLLVKIIQFSSNRRLKINLALILKIGFYLIAFLLAVTYIGHDSSPSRNLFHVVSLLGIFLIHTYWLIPRYALESKLHMYSKSLCSILFIGLAGLFISEQRNTSVYSVLVLTDLYFGLVILSWLMYYINLLASRKYTIKNLVTKGDLNLELAINLIIIFLANSVFIAGAGHNNTLNQALIFYTIILLFYFHTFVSFPRFFTKERIIQFLGINAVILLSASIVMITLDAIQSYYALKNIGVETKIFELFSFRNVRVDLLFLFSLILIPSFVYYFIKDRFKNLESTGFTLYRKKEAELAQLRSQVNPHFLFNTLNTLYAFALKEGSEKTAECIAKLANLMRFMLDDMEKESILLQREVSYIQDYVKLQSIRSAVDHDIAITIDIEEEQGYSIAPMLLIPFVENAFKHGINPNKVSQLKIDITGKGNKIQFVIENSIDENFEAYYKEKGFGIGIENVKSRLKYIYPNRHNISIAKINGKFIVILTIDIL